MASKQFYNCQTCSNYATDDVADLIRHTAADCDKAQPEGARCQAVASAFVDETTYHVQCWMSEMHHEAPPHQHVGFTGNGESVAWTRDVAT